MMKLRLLFAGLLLSGSALAAPETPLKVGSLAEVPIASLHPTQATLGFRQIDYKVNRYKHDAKKLFDDFCESAGAKGIEKYNDASRISDFASFSCKTAPGSELKKVNTAVIAPDNQLYLTDGHHTFTSFAEVGGLQTKVYVRITDDFRHLPNMTAFWQTMQARKLTWLETPQGVITPQQLPQQLSRKQMINDEYRSLVWLTRDIGYRKPDSPPPFLEFYWGKWLATQLPLSKMDLTSQSGYAAAVESAAEKMVAAPAETLLAQTDSGPLTAEKAGQMSRVNQKALRKLVSATGKLTYAFAN
ncbi:hypothetical protein F3J40_19215 [Pantoea sp. Acro-835]|uniref:ParB-like nuclease n=2 Tax=Candidatus Pantoea multigeneris TaxID=2608357 RepID=A0ABX0RF81_9GAMM|nr:hypothetical protein [Pantoea multigeneris]